MMELPPYRDDKKVDEIADISKKEMKVRGNIGRRNIFELQAKHNNSSLFFTQHLL